MITPPMILSVLIWRLLVRLLELSALAARGFAAAIALFEDEEPQL